MKKFILPLVLLLAIGMLAAVQSEASDVVGYVKYDCYAGVNYIALPLGTVTLAEDIGTLHLPLVTSIYKWNATAQGWTSISYDAEYEEWGGTMPVVNGDVIVMASTGPFSFYSLGDVAVNSPYSIKTGYNRISLPLDRSDVVDAATIGDEIGGQTAIYKWSNVLQGWTSISYDQEYEEWGGVMPISIGDPIVTGSTVETTWPAAAKQINSKTIKTNSK